MGKKKKTSSWDVTWDELASGFGGGGGSIRLRKGVLAFAVGFRHEPCLHLRWGREEYVREFELCFG